MPTATKAHHEERHTNTVTRITDSVFSRDGTRMSYCSTGGSSSVLAAMPMLAFTNTHVRSTKPTCCTVPDVHEDWTYRETEVHLAEHQELRNALGLAWVPNYTTPYRCLRRLEDSNFDQLLANSRPADATVD